jgi:hypothetical protein
MKTTIVPCIGPALTGMDFEDGTFWCNRHLHVVRPGQPNRHAIVVDTDYPLYGTGATLNYPSDSYPLVVVGGSKSGKTLYFARVNVRGAYGKRTFFERQELLDNMDLTNIIVARSRLGDSRYSDNIVLGWASYYQSREV